MGLGLKPGDRHYRAFVGPPEKYDIVAAMQFNLLTFMGLREYHYLVDIGCGSLRAGRLFIPYLLPERYHGIEPEKWLVKEGIKKQSISKFGVTFDFAVAQSIFSHACQQQIHVCLNEISKCLKRDGDF